MKTNTQIALFALSALLTGLSHAAENQSAATPPAVLPSPTTPAPPNDEPGFGLVIELVLRSDVQRHPKEVKIRYKLVHEGPQPAKTPGSDATPQKN
jgi:hypothetical protein